MDFKDLLEIDAVGNVPYFPHLITKLIRERLERIQGIELGEDEHALYVKVGKGKGRQVVVETHLDHPGYVIGENGQVRSVGTVCDSTSIHAINTLTPKPVSFYDQQGNHICDGKIDEIKIAKNRLTAIPKPDLKKKLPQNTQVLPLVKRGVEEGQLHLRSADNLATAFVCLKLANLMHDSNVNLTLVFSKLEEVAQITATGLALMGATPFERLKNDTAFVVLEVASVFQGKSVDKSKLALAKTENGISFDPNANNLTRRALLKSASKLGMTLDEVDLESHSDAISYFLVGGYQNVSCLCVNSENRHNIDSKGEFAPEIVNLKSLENMKRLLVDTVEDLSSQPSSGISLRRKLTATEVGKKRKLIRLYRWAQPRLILEKLYPDNLTENLVFKLSSLMGRTYPQ